MEKKQNLSCYKYTLYSTNIYDKVGFFPKLKVCYKLKQSFSLFLFLIFKKYFSSF